MLNIASLSALLRTLRQAGDGALASVERVQHVRRVAAESDAHLPAQSSGADARRALVPPALTSFDAPGASPIAARSPATPAPMRAQATAVDPQATRNAASTALDLTRAGALVSEALRTRATTGTRLPAVEASEPLVATPRMPVVELARALARSLADSGLFYEAHLARWARRDYPASALAREPQAQWATAEVNGQRVERTSALPEAAATLLTRQLDALDARAVTWTGQTWPGQRATITFEEAPPPARDADADDAGSATATRWHTRIALELPALGKVEASLALAGNALHLGLATDDADAAMRLADARAELAAALAGSRIALAGFAVDRA